MPEPRKPRGLRGVLRLRLPGGVQDQVRQRHLRHGRCISMYIYKCMCEYFIVYMCGLTV